jgi:hypothetical protein
MQQTQPDMYAAIQANPQAFQLMMMQAIAGQAQGAGGMGAGAGGMPGMGGMGGMPGQPTGNPNERVVSLTQEEMDAVDRVVSMGFSK